MSERLEELEANVRKLMAAHSKIQPRGFDTIRRRHALHEEIDRLLDTRTAWLEIHHLDDTTARPHSHD